MSGIIGHVGSKGELYPPKKLREKLGLKPGVKVEYVLSSNNELIIRIVKDIKELIKEEPIAEIDLEKFEELSEEIQKKGGIIE